jgi:hypothetical protein
MNILKNNSKYSNFFNIKIGSDNSHILSKKKNILRIEINGKN